MAEERGPADRPPAQAYLDAHREMFGAEATFPIAEVVVVVPTDISDWQFATVLREDGVLTQSEAEDFCGAGIIPAQMVDAIDTISDETLRGQIRIKVRGAKTYSRNDQTTLLLASLLGYNEEMVLDVWARGAAI